MKKTIKICCLFFVCMVVVFGQAIFVSADETITETVTLEQQQAAVAYWTPARIASAIPATPMIEGAPPEQDALFEEESGEPGFITSSKDGRTSVLLTGDEAAAMALSGGIEPTADGYDTYPPPENTYPIPVTWYGSFPIRAVGKVYFSAGGYNYVCSGSAIGNRGVLTAGHCLAPGNGTWTTNWIFRPAWRDPWAPYGTWTAYAKNVYTVWFNNGGPGGYCRDVGAAKVSDLGGSTLAATVGHLGFSWNHSRLQHWSMHGYPSSSPWVGSIQVKTGASYSNTVDPGCISGPSTTGAGTRQTPGCSGGPWIRTYRPQQWGANNYANGVFSYYYTASPLRMYSPYFDTSVKTDIYDWAITIP